MTRAVWALKRPDQDLHVELWRVLANPADVSAERHAFGDAKPGKGRDWVALPQLTQSFDAVALAFRTGRRISVPVLAAGAVGMVAADPECSDPEALQRCKVDARARAGIEYPLDKAIRVSSG